MQALRTAATGMAAQQMNVEVISNNIANMNTVGYKKQRAEFQDLLYQTVQQAGAQSSDQGTIVPTGVQIGAGVKAGSVYRISTQGALTSTGNQYDLAINGRGFFQVLTPTGDIAYTRAGNFSVNDQGQLVTQDGYQVQPAIAIPQDATNVTISPSGQVQVTQPSSTTPTVVGQLELASFMNEGGLSAQGGNLFLQTGASGAPITGVPGVQGFGTLMQGYTEASNVDPVTEITSLIVAQRAYEMNSKVISTADNMLQVANQVKQ
ncbi:MAG TPA: flagellar basal-body rod protein FlgG [Phenylobacterium sp.]|jgi:flagellar basal-body rod protein FlgG|uniref:flagellar basal-body rod protein FlgG n=1 Tax=Phenylobacterium sp. TaxID=1871053 RepID=UPI002D578D28|nr:flagellar basal-body rod protein FlgG [Phenylobacterium sp.]HZZ66965.1 flagellar basal-body rod protein FlgG [Phenylobacterium sp.]